ncbi:dTDP-4-dehydrorhamnose 3,5-epimerase [Streptomyces viridochromogenes]|uniref:dTDP-4-dehydrorhamnose 3,5-epimerase n=1 Tax=Streptomyces viridochromogenes TaxID=1938 RepID=A0A0J8CH45_STRVR|nr:dTDP-4-dehydrorhamnose 3,5-epimerase family protein [Streptomyces viridochromogenes]KMS77325.1 dTDP-4-dehydrorhamnose 3,5-epimerase [Streptomyces viridochromogenes]KOG19048.1 dTDP-4-dehydrorhamnose 3,5-epimerase [Streptomyces viridochromogenes]KOG19287.1 dTDP-4-dehydrorhamnose 3,5-epimerase [Streptomyces viridochromogenes]
MEIQPLTVPGSYLMIPQAIPDARGSFHEAFKESEVSRALGRRFTPRQINYSVSRRGVLRGIHSVLLPPGQAKIVTCHRGAIRDIVVDLRLGSPTYGAHDVNVLTAREGASVFVAEGLGHGFAALTDDTVVGYLCSTEYVPDTPVEINPLDPDLNLPWDLEEPILSAKDAAAPTAAEATRAGLLPTYEECLAWYARM